MNIKALIRPGTGAADITPLLRDRAAFHAAIEGLALPFVDTAIDLVACVEGRGFLLGSAVAFRLGAGLVPLRPGGRLKAAMLPRSVSYSDYSRQPRVLEMHSDAIHPGDRVLLVDDWVETAGTVRAGLALIEGSGGIVAGIAVLVDGTLPETRHALERYIYRFLIRVEPGDPF